MGSQKSEAHIATIVDIDATCLELADRRVGFTLTRFRNDDRFGQPRGDIKMRVQTRPVTGRLVIVGVGDGPCDLRDGGNKSAIDSHGSLEQRLQIMLRGGGTR